MSLLKPIQLGWIGLFIHVYCFMNGLDNGIYRMYETFVISLREYLPEEI
jgi:hypothetical protein